MKYFSLLILISILNFTVVANNKISDQEKDDYTYNYKYKKGCHEVYDPYEKLNRKIFTFNAFLDYFFLKPITIGYKRITNDYTKERVNSFVNNVATPVTAINYGLQLNYDQTMKSLWRFFINTTFGIGGLFDVASKIGLIVPSQSFGSTLAKYGVGPGPYLVLPVLGSTNTRDVTDSIFTNTYFNPIMYIAHRDFKIVTSGLNIIDTRLVVLPFTDYVEKSSTDPYIAIRSATHQNRESKVFYPTQFLCPK